MGFGDGLHDGQAEPESAGFTAAVWLSAGETAEDPVQVGRRDAAAEDARNRRAVLAGLPLALALAAEQQEGKAAFLGYRLRDVT